MAARSNDEDPNIPSFMRPLKRNPRRNAQPSDPPKAEERPPRQAVALPNALPPLPPTQNKAEPRRFATPPPRREPPLAGVLTSMPSSQSLDTAANGAVVQHVQATQEFAPPAPPNPPVRRVMPTSNENEPPAQPEVVEAPQTTSSPPKAQFQVVPPAAAPAQPKKNAEKEERRGRGGVKRQTTLMPAAKYKLVYLNLRGKGEAIRLLLNFLQEPFEDHRENYLEFAKGKDQFPMPRLPKLVVDGKLELCYTAPILAYLGRKHGLDGETDEERAICDVLGARISEYMNLLKPWVYCLMGLAPPDRLDELTETVFNTCVQKDFGPVFERQLEVNNSGYLVGDKLTWIDFMAAAFTDMCITFGEIESMDKFRRVTYHRNAVFSLPQIQEHLKNRPDTVY